MGSQTLSTTTSSSQMSSPVHSGLLPGGEVTDVSELGEVSKQVWTFVESQCWDADTGHVNTQNITFWLRTLLQQNSDLVEVVAKLERDARDRVTILEEKLNKTTAC